MKIIAFYRKLGDTTDRSSLGENTGCVAGAKWVLLARPVTVTENTNAQSADNWDLCNRQKPKTIFAS